MSIPGIPESMWKLHAATSSARREFPLNVRRVSIQWRGKHCIKLYPNSTLILFKPSVNACTIQPTLHFIGFCHTIINILVTLPHISQRTLQFAQGRRISITWSDNSCFYLFWSDEAMNSASQLDIVQAGSGSVSWPRMANDWLELWQPELWTAWIWNSDSNRLNLIKLWYKIKKCKDTEMVARIRTVSMPHHT